MADLQQRYAAVARKRVDAPDFGSQPTLNGLLRHLAIWRSRLIANTIVRTNGTVIQSGPFVGMDYVDYATEGCLAPRLLGVYESDLHPTIQAFAAAGLDAIIDIGCAEGYYAVGMARLSPQTVVYAQDIDERARNACIALAAKNGVADRVKVGGEFKGEDFAAFAGQKVLVLMDAEGAEDDLLHPARWTALQGMNLLVETHNMYRPGVKQRLIERFSPSHDIEVINYAPGFAEMPEWLKTAPPLDQLLATWEWRAGPTPWLVMRPKSAVL